MWGMARIRTLVFWHDAQFVLLASNLVMNLTNIIWRCMGKAFKRATFYYTKNNSVKAKRQKALAFIEAMSVTNKIKHAHEESIKLEDNNIMEETRVNQSRNMVKKETRNKKKCHGNKWKQTVNIETEEETRRKSIRNIPKNISYKEDGADNEIEDDNDDVYIPESDVEEETLLEIDESFSNEPTPEGSLSSDTEPQDMLTEDEHDAQFIKEGNEQMVFDRKPTEAWFSVEPLEIGFINVEPVTSTVKVKDCSILVERLKLEGL